MDGGWAQSGGLDAVALGLAVKVKADFSSASDCPSTMFRTVSMEPLPSDEPDVPSKVTIQHVSRSQAASGNGFSSLEGFVGGEDDGRYGGDHD